jgi:hypothetical protein
MATHIIEDDTTRLLEVQVTGKLTGQDYERLAPEVERFIQQHGKIRMIFDMHDFHGWNGKSLLTDLQFGAKHRHDIQRLALVGEKSWQNWSSKCCRIFTDAEVRFFDRRHADEAKAWVRNY